MSNVPYQSVSLEVWQDKYQLKDSQGQPLEPTMEDTFKRVADKLAEGERNTEVWSQEFFEAIARGATPAGRVMANIGAEAYKPATSSINCTVSQIVEDSITGILDANKNAGITLSAGCGIGYEFSTLRPRGAYVNGAGASTSGSLSFMDIFNSTCFTISSAGGRRGAQMGTMAVWHPDVEAFIKAKRQNGAYRQFNLSLLIDNDFIEAVKNDWEHHLCFPIKKREEILAIEGKINVVGKKRFWEKWYCEQEDYVLDPNDNLICKVYKTLKARELWDTIMKSTYDFAEPGFILIDEVNRMNPLHFMEELRATNPSLIAGTLVHTKKGFFPIEELEGTRFQVRARDGSWGDAECWKSGDSENTISIGFKGGMSTSATPKHKFPVLQKDGSIQRCLTSDLKIGDLIPKNNISLSDIEGDTTLTEDDGFFLGVWLADGHASYTKNGDMVVGFTFNLKDEDMANRILDYCNERKVNKSTIRHRKDSLEFTIGEKAFIQTLIEKFGIHTGAKQFPKIVWKSNDKFIKGFIDGFISGDGYVEVNTSNNKARLIVTQKNPDILVNFSKLLSFFGITGSFLYKQGFKANFPNKKDYGKLYDRSDFKLGTSAVKKFKTLFSLTCGRKQNVLNNVSNLIFKRKERINEDYLQISSLIENNIGVPVWDVAVDHHEHLFPIQWGYTGNCGEQPLPPYGSCLLGSLITTRYIKYPFTKEMYFDWDLFRKDVRIFTRMLDNVVEFNGLPLPEQRHEIMYKRRHGMGLTGIGSAMSILGMQYGSQKSLMFVDELMRNLVVEGFKEGILLAKEKGRAPVFYDSTNGKSNLEQWVESPYMQKVWKVAPELRERALLHGCRFTHHSSIAPTGTMSFSFGNNVSNGIEPTFTHTYVRNILKQGKKAKMDETVYSYEALLYKVVTGKDELPPEWSTTDNITPKQHVDVQATAQYWLDSACSKTINVPSDIPFEDFKNVYLYAHEKGLKGCTTFRFNPEAFSGVLVKTDDLEATTYTFQLADGTTVSGKGNDRVVYENEEYSVQNLFDAIKEGYYDKI